MRYFLRTYFISFLVTLVLLVFPPVSPAASHFETPDLLPTSFVRSLLEQDPGVISARANLEIARQESHILARSPYEWNAKLSGQRRSVQDDLNYREWNVGLERTLRLPGKAAADRQIGNATVEEYEARYGDALHEAAIDLLNFWLDWSHAERRYGLAELIVQTAQESVNAVKKRIRAGDAAKVDMGLAQAELADQQLMLNDMKTQAMLAWVRLQAHFPQFDRRFITMPEPSPIEQELAFWRERILDQSDELKTVQAQLSIAEANAERIRADKIPDPTVGVHTGTEFGGRERIVGMSISFPIPGGQRNERAIQAVQHREVRRQEAERVRRHLEAAIASRFIAVCGAYAGLKIAQVGNANMQDNARLMKRAYELGEVDLQALFAAQRQSITAMQNVEMVKFNSLKEYYLLLIDAHLIWDLQHD